MDTKGLSYVFIYKEEHQHVLDALPINCMKILIDDTIIDVFRVSKVPALIIYKGTIEIKRVHGTENIKDYKC